MRKKELKLDFGEHKEAALKFFRQNKEKQLANLFEAFDAKSAEEIPQEYYEQLMANFIIQPVNLISNKSITVSLQEEPRVRDNLDALWEKEQAEESSRTTDDDISNYPLKIRDKEAARIAYYTEMEAIADFLKNGLSVLVVCDKMLTELIYEFVCSIAGKKVVLDTDDPAKNKRSTGVQVKQALQGGNANPLANLPQLISNLKSTQVLVLRSLDMLDSPEFIELLYQPTQKNEKAQLLAFLDPSLKARKVLTDRFALHVPIMGLPRYISLDKKNTVYTVSHLLTREERACFKAYDPEGLYKNVSGLNAIQFRNAMQYVGAKVAKASKATDIYRIIRQFKISSNDEIEIPDTIFDNIGGYEHVKQQLRRTISLIGGGIKGLDEKKRGQLIPKGFIFHGPPGTGKTLFAKAIANEMNATIQIISGPEIMDKYVGESENNLRRIFATARRNAPAVIFFDEFDSLASQRSNYSDGGARANNAVVAQLLTELDGFRQDQTVLLIGTTNRIDIIDEALLRPSRLSPIEIPLPDFEARRQVSLIHAESFGVDKLLINLFDLSINHVFEAKTDYSGNDADIQVPKQFLEQLFEQHEPFKIRYEVEEQQVGFLRLLNDFFAFVHQLKSRKEKHSAIPFLDLMSETLLKLGAQHGIKLSPDIAANMQDKNWRTPMEEHLHQLLQLIENEKQPGSELNAKTFFHAVINLIAEYTINFNNDEIRAIFQEASLEYHMDGQLITPRYLGTKIGLIQKRRNEREAVHLTN